MEPAGPVDLDRLRRLLGAEDLRWLVDRVRKRMARGEPLDTTVTLAAATTRQRMAVDRLLGRRPRPGSALTVPLGAVDDVLRRSGACPGGIAAAVVALTGPVARTADAEAEIERRWSQAFAPLEAAARARPELVDWLQHVRATGLVRRLVQTPEAAAPVLETLSRVVNALPAGGEPLGRFAALTADGAHDLDDGRPLTTLALGAARALSGLPHGSGAQWRREVWASVGVLTDEVSSTVLTFGLPGDASTPTGRVLGVWQDAGQPVVLTLRQLVRDPPALRVREVFVCENPVVVSAAADRLGRSCKPLICTAGQPGAATMHLLRQIAASGATIRHRGDFDWGGIRIGNVLHERLPSSPWRFGHRDYLATERHGRMLTGPPARAQWDDALSGAMQERGVAVEEELLIDELLGDLAR